MKHLVLLFSFFFIAVVAEGAGNVVPYAVDGRDYEGYYITPSKEAPLVLLIHDWDGLNEYEIKRAGMLADLGYAVFAADMFGKGVRPKEISEKRRLTGELYEDRKKMRALVRGAHKTAKAMGAKVDSAVAMGYCFGGTVVLEYARSGADMKGFVSFHGGLATPEGQDYGNINGKLLVLHGTADKVVTMDQFAALAEELESHGVPHEMITYSGAPHAFTVFGSERYREEADRKSWKRFAQFLEQQLL